MGYLIFSLVQRVCVGCNKLMVKHGLNFEVKQGEECMQIISQNLLKDKY